MFAVYGGSGCSPQFLNQPITLGQCSPTSFGFISAAYDELSIIVNITTNSACSGPELYSVFTQGDVCTPLVGYNSGTSNSYYIGLSNYPPPNITLSLYSDDSSCANPNAIYANNIPADGTCNFIQGYIDSWYIKAILSGASVTVEYHSYPSDPTCSRSPYYTSVFPANARCEPLLLSGSPTGYYVSTFPAPNVLTALSLSISPKKVVIGTSVTLTTSTTPSTSNLNINFMDSLSSSSLGTAMSDGNGVATLTYTSQSSNIYQVQATYGSIVSPSSSLVFLALNGQNAFNDYGNAPQCNANMWVTGGVNDESGTPSSGAIGYFGGSHLFAAANLNRGQGPITQATAYETDDISMYYSGTTSDSNINTWFICS